LGADTFLGKHISGFRLEVRAVSIENVEEGIAPMIWASVNISCAVPLSSAALIVVPRKSGFS